MQVTLECPQAEYRAEMVIWCRRTEEICAFQYFKACKGWWALTGQADGCRLRNQPEENGGDKHE